MAVYSRMLHGYFKSSASMQRAQRAVVNWRATHTKSDYVRPEVGQIVNIRGQKYKIISQEEKQRIRDREWASQERKNRFDDKNRRKQFDSSTENYHGYD